MSDFNFDSRSPARTSSRRVDPDRGRGVLLAAVYVGAVVLVGGATAAILVARSSNPSSSTTQHTEAATSTLRTKPTTTRGAKSRTDSAKDAAKPQDGHAPAHPVVRDKSWEVKAERELAKLPADEAATCQKLFELVRDERLVIKALDSREYRLLKIHGGGWLLTPWLATQIIEDAGRGATDLCAGLHCTDPQIRKQIAFAYWHYEGEERLLLDEFAKQSIARGDPTKVDPELIAKFREPRFRLLRSSMQK